MKTSEKLAEVKKYIVPPHLAGQLMQVPGAIDYKVMDRPEPLWISPVTAALHCGYNEVGRLLQERMHGQKNMFDYLWYVARVPMTETHPFRVQNHCLNWIDELIKEFKAKGD